MCYSAARLRARLCFFQRETCRRYSNGGRDLCLSCSDTKKERKKKSPFKPHFLEGDYCSDSRERITFSDVTVYICDTNDSCGFACGTTSQSPKLLR